MTSGADHVNEQVSGPPRRFAPLKSARRHWQRAVGGSFSANVLTTLIAQGVSLIFSVANAAVVARFLGPEGKGTVAVAMMVPAVLTLLVNGGIGIANVYLVGSQRISVSLASRNSVAMAIVASSVGLAAVSSLKLGGILDSLIPGVPAAHQWLAMALLPVGILDGYISSILQGLQLIHLLNFAAVGQAVVVFGAAVVLVVGLKLGVAGAILAAVVGACAALVTKMTLLHRRGASFQPIWNRNLMRMSLGFGLKGQLGNILQFFNYRLDTFILNYYRGLSAVGIYGAAVTLAELLWQLPNAVGFVIFPKAAATAPERMNRLTPRILRVTLALTAGAALALALASRYIVEAVYSAAFLDAVGPLLALLPGVVLLGGAKILANEIAGRGYPQYNSIASGLALVLTVLLDIVLIPRWGAVGAGAASSVSYVAVFVVAGVGYTVVSRRAAATRPDVSVYRAAEVRADETV